ncbi:MAG: glycosyltransferase family 4 protein [Gammaproteobacteria bacterium]|nr:glycosyltransferase family 4 protein [Gammaproteobacteria bacterium]
MLDFVIEALQRTGAEISLAYYKPYSVAEELSVPLHKIFFRRPQTLEEQYKGIPCFAIGCWLPELEFTHYRRSRHWDTLIESHDLHLAVSGSCMAARSLLEKRVSFMGWIATDWEGDRFHRVSQFSLLRRTLDRLLIQPVAKRIEKRIIDSGRLVALSAATLEQMNSLVPQPKIQHVVHRPIDTDKFKPSQQPVGRPTIGFIGRFEDPRKNLSLLFHVTQHLLRDFPDLKLMLVGDQLSSTSEHEIDELGIGPAIEVHDYVEQEALPILLNKLDVFVLPSHQEGLCIAALEAMACGVPVVSTRCGGPESYIDSGRNGVLCEHDAGVVADAVLQLLSEPERRATYAARARRTIIEQFSVDTQSQKFIRLMSDYTSSMPTNGPT